MSETTTIPSSKIKLVAFSLVLIGLAAAGWTQPAGNRAYAASTSVLVVTDQNPGSATEHGLDKLIQALEAKGLSVVRSERLETTDAQTVIIAGLSTGPNKAARLLNEKNISVPDAPEALVIRHTQWNGNPALLVGGSDDRGLMYGLLEVANRIGWVSDAQKPLSEVRDVTEKPAVPERAVSVYTMHQKYFESRFFNENHWARYLDMLAENRFNAFALLFAYENAGYFAPAYPYFFDVEGFPGVHVVGFTKEDQQRHFKALKRLIEMTQQRGLKFTIGFWDHIYRGGVQSGGMDVDPGEAVPGIVAGVTQDNLMAYNQAALERFLKLFPEVDAVQFRMHGESGLKEEEMTEFWRGIYQVMMDNAPHMEFTARAKGFPDSLIDLAVNMGVNIRIATKYWAEQMGLPFHPSHINLQNQFDRRHGYADLLRYPKTYDLHWRLWNGGTTRILLWGDPEWVRRFAQSTHLYDGNGFEINEMLATKMASQPHDMEPFQLLKPEHQYYQDELDRYWHFYQVFGRIGYNPETPPQVWRKEFESRFGKAAAPYVEQGLHRASWILPMIQSYNFPYNRFPTTRGWIEKQRREDLPDYARADGSDTQQFLSISDAARNRLEGRDSAKLHPLETSQWFAQTAEDVLKLVEQAEAQIGNHRNKEFVSTKVDLKILANLALYHSRRIPAGINWALYKQSGDLSALDAAIVHEQSAIEAWERLVKAAGDVYADNLRMGLDRSGLTGHWRHELVALQKGLEELEAERRAFQPAVPGGAPLIAHAPVRRALPRKDLVLSATISAKDPIENVQLAYRIGPDGDYEEVDMQKSAPHVYRAVIPGLAVTEGLAYYIEAQDQSDRESSYPLRGEVYPVVVMVTRDDEAPSVAHTPVTSAPAEQPLTIRATISDPSGVRWARVRHRSVSQYQDYKSLAMHPTDKKNEYVAVIPGEDVASRWDFMYLLEVMDEKGNGRIYPNLYQETPYIVVKLLRNAELSQAQ
ncbi:MAG: hypothetical protein ACRD1R_04680 [Acidobacteriota bacterium]